RDVIPSWRASALSAPKYLGHAGACPSSLAAEGIDPGNVVTNDQGVDVMRAFISVNTLEIHQVANHGVTISNSHRAQNIARFAGTLERHPNIVALGQRNLRGARRARFHHPGQTQRE